MGKFHRILCLIAVLAAALTTAGVAAASCNPGRAAQAGDWFDGWEAGPDFGGVSCLVGSRAHIRVKGPYIHSAWDSSWTMIFNPSSGRYGQVGYQKDVSGAIYSFDESRIYDPDVGHDVTVTNYPIGPGDPSVGDTPEYKVTYSSGWMHYFVDGNDSDDVQLHYSYGGCDAEQGGEIKNKANQLPGEVNSHEIYSSAGARKVVDGVYSWITPNWTDPFSLPSVSWAGHSAPASDELDIWDTACLG